MASAYQQTSHYANQPHSAAPSGQEKVNLPSLKSLNFPYSSPQSQEGSPMQNGPSQSEHVPAPSAYAGRHDNASWGRNPPPAPQSQPHYSQAMAPPPKPTNKGNKQPAYRTEGYARPEQPMHKPNGTWSAPPATFQAPPPPPSGSPSDSASQGPLKRGRTDSAVSASSGRSPHTPYSTYGSQPHTPSPMYQVPNGAAQQSEAIQQPSPFTQPGPGGYPYAPPQHSPRGPYPSHQAPPPQQHQPQQPQQHQPQQHQQSHQQQSHQQQSHQQQHQQHHSQPQQHQPQHQPQQQQQVPPGNPYSQQPPPQHWQPSAAGNGPAPQAQTQPPQMQNFVQTRPIVPANIDPRAAPPQPPAPPQTVASPSDERVARQSIINEIVKHCSMLWTFANKYAQMLPHLQPGPDELRDMSHFATQVVQLLEEFRRLSPAGEQPPRESVAVAPVIDEQRPPKRPWEDMERDNQETPSDTDIRYGDETSQSTAEQDMEIIRSKRATSSTGTTPGQPKSKYRKRSRATPPGKCHSCNIRETPEWRRGPDGARTLCNACGLHYAKLMRKREKTLGADGKPVPIDLQTLRLSTLASKEHGKGQHHDPSRQSMSGPSSQQGDEHGPSASTPSGYEPTKQSMQPQPHPSHGGPYQASSVSTQGAPPPAPSPHQMMHPPPLQSQPVMQQPPQSPWMTSPTSSRGFPPSSEPPVYMRPPHNPAHARGSPQ